MKTVKGKVDTRYKGLALPEDYLIVDNEEYIFTNRTIDPNYMVSRYVYLTCVVDDDNKEVLEVVGA